MSFNSGMLNFDETFLFKTDSLLKVKNLTLIKSAESLFKDKPAYWYLVKGFKNGYPFHQFNLLVKNTANTYFSAYSEIYGDDLMDERLCSSISILENIEFLE